MDLTPRDIQQKQFNDAFRGYSHEEVDAFLDEIAEAFSKTYRENQNLQLRLRETEKELSLAKQTEDMLKRTLLTAQQTVDETVGEAKARAQEIDKVANAKAAEILVEAQARVMEIRASIEGLKRYEREYRERLRAFMQNQLEVLDGPSAEPVQPDEQPEPAWPQAVQDAHSQLPQDLRPAPLPPRRQPEQTHEEAAPSTVAAAKAVPETPQYSSPAPVPAQAFEAAFDSPEEMPSPTVSGARPAPTMHPDPALVPGGPGQEAAATGAAVMPAGPSTQAATARVPHSDAGGSGEATNGEAGRRADKPQEKQDEKSISEMFWGED